MSDQHPAAVLWDMDGTLVDTEPYWMLAQTELAGRFGASWTAEHAITVVGKSLWFTAEAMQAAGVEMEAGAIIDVLTDRVLEQIEVRMPWRPGAEALLADLRTRGIKTGLVTMSIRRMAMHVATAMPFEAFDVIVSLDDVVHAKPHPEPYLTAAGLLDVSIRECVALEDSPTGVTSAAAAGAVTIGVPHYIDLAPTPADLLWDSLEGRHAGSVAEEFRIVRARRDRESA